MNRYKLHIGHYVISISGFASDQPVWFRQQLKVHKGATIELTIPFPQDPPARFNIPFPVTPYILRKLVARHWGILWPDQLKVLHDGIYEFAKDVADNQSWYRPYRPFADGFEDCVAIAWPVTANGITGAVEAEEFVKSWLR